MDLLLEEDIAKELENFANNAIGNIEDLTKSCVVHAESCELYLATLANLIDTQVTQNHFQGGFDNKENNQVMLTHSNAKCKDQKLIGSQNIFKRVYDNLPRLENHVCTIIDGRHFTEKCKTLLAKIKLDLWYAMKL